MNPLIRLAADAIRHPTGVATFIGGHSSHGNNAVMGLLNAIMNDVPIAVGESMQHVQEQMSQVLPSIGAGQSKGWTVGG